MDKQRVVWETTCIIDGHERKVRCFGTREPGPEGKPIYGFGMTDRETNEDLTAKDNTPETLLSRGIDMMIATSGQ